MLYYFQSAPFKRPRLRKGAVPSQFPWTEETEKTEMNVGAEVQDLDPSTNTGQESKKDKELLFHDVVNAATKNKIHMPKGWAYIEMDTKVLIFFLQTHGKLKNTNRYTVYSKKEVILNENMNIEINIMKQPLTDFSNIQICQNIETLEQLTESLFLVHNFNTCSGIVNNRITDLGHREAFKDAYDTWRHKKCQLVISKELKICKFCKNVIHSLNRKHSRRTIVKKLERIKFDTSLHCTDYKKKLSLLQRKYYRAEKARKRSKYVANKLKTELMNCMAKIEEVTRDGVEEQLKKYNIPKNERCAMLEVLQAAKCANPKSRRYNEDWILMCMLIHMKSPSAYDFLRTNEILPLPTIRTIQR